MALRRRCRYLSRSISPVIATIVLLVSTVVIVLVATKLATSYIGMQGKTTILEASIARVEVIDTGGYIYDLNYPASKLYIFTIVIHNASPKPVSLTHSFEARGSVTISTTSTADVYDPKIATKVLLNLDLDEIDEIGPNKIVTVQIAVPTRGELPFDDGTVVYKITYSSEYGTGVAVIELKP